MVVRAQRMERRARVSGRLLLLLSALGSTPVACGDSDKPPPPRASAGSAGTALSGAAGQAASGAGGGMTAGTAGTARGGSAGSATSGAGGTSGEATGGMAGDDTDGMAGDAPGGMGGEDSGTGGTAGSGAVGAGAGGTSGMSGMGGMGGTRPVGPAIADKVDLLFVIDNSISMSDKQEILSEAVPVLVGRLVRPLCVDTGGDFTGDAAPCPSGSTPEFQPIDDIHVGVITTSIGDHGSTDVCAEGSSMNPNATYDDKAQFVPTVYSTLSNRAGLPSWNGHGFLVWDPREATNGVVPHDPPGYGSPLAMSPGDEQAFVTAFTDHVRAAGELGCGYEAPLESWYRFLADPEPPSSMSNDGRVSVRGTVNQALLAQRAAFLRDDSVLAIVMLSDENDCSILDEGGTQGWLVAFKGGVNANSWRMPRAHAVCATNPNDVGCMPCGAGDADPGCMGGTPYAPAEDAPNVRCYRQKQRFGIDLLYPVNRYVEALTSPTIDPRFSGNPVPNPIFGAGALTRNPRLIVLAGIVGVPWQDLATADTLNEARDLEYLTTDELASLDRWDVILGDPEEAVDPTDPFMIESIDPRPIGATSPVLPGVSILAPGASPLNPINGHEQAVIAAERGDLQFACIFPLPTPRVCDSVNEGGCDCNAQEYPKNSPLCSYPAANVDGTQERGKAYPALRELSVLQGIGDSAVVASICPKNIAPAGGLTAETDPSYGYNPAMTAIVDRMKAALP